MELEGPIYPKENLEYRQIVLQNLYKRIKNTDWKDPSDKGVSNIKKGRKPKDPPKPAPQELKVSRNKFFKINN